MRETKPTKLIVAITGATGNIFGVRLLQLLQGSGVETHLILSKWGARTLIHETDYTVEQVESVVTRNYLLGDQGEKISSGSFTTLGMVIAPCSMRTLAAIANGLGDNLIHRAADVILKERRKLVLSVRETPFNDIHLENMLKLSRMGAVICPPLPAYYTRPQTVDDIVTWSAARLLDQVGAHVATTARSDGERGWRVRSDLPPYGTRSRRMAARRAALVLPLSLFEARSEARCEGGRRARPSRAAGASSQARRRQAGRRETIPITRGF